MSPHPNEACNCFFDTNCGCPVHPGGQTYDQRIDELEAQLTEVRRVLKLVEWIGDDQMPHCHVCDVERWDGAGGKHGHAPDCALAKMLEGT